MQIERLLGEVREGLNRGESFVVYPAGRIYRQNIRRVKYVEAIPVLGTGKADYRALRATQGPRGQLRQGPSGQLRQGPRGQLRQGPSGQLRQGPRG